MSRKEFGHCVEALASVYGPNRTGKMAYMYSDHKLVAEAYEKIGAVEFVQQFPQKNHALLTQKRIRASKRQ